MELNPYQSPLNDARASERRFLLSEGRLLVAVLAVAASTVAGFPIGAIGGFVVLALTPRELRPSCGNTILDPMALAGAIVGFAVGLSFSWQRICRQPPPPVPME